MHNRQLFKLETVFKGSIPTLKRLKEERMSYCLPIDSLTSQSGENMSTNKQLELFPKLIEGKPKKNKIIKVKLTNKRRKL